VTLTDLAQFSVTKHARPLCDSWAHSAALRTSLWIQLFSTIYIKFSDIWRYCRNNDPQLSIKRAETADMFNSLKHRDVLATFSAYAHKTHFSFNLQISGLSSVTRGSDVIILNCVNRLDSELQPSSAPRTQPWRPFRPLTASPARVWPSDKTLDGPLSCNSTSTTTALNEGCVHD